MNAFYGKSYDSWVENILGKDKNDSTSTSAPSKDEDEEFCIDLLCDGAIDDDFFLLDNPPCDFFCLTYGRMKMI